MKIPLIEDIELALYRHFNRQICLPTTTMFFEHEIDFLTVRKDSGYAAEVEIKRSLSDMKAEAKKNHNHQSNKIAQLFYCFPQVLAEKCMELVPDRAGVLEVYWTGFSWKIAVKRHAKRNVDARPLTDREINKILRYSNYRIWSFKRQIVKLKKQADDQNRKNQKP